MNSCLLFSLPEVFDSAEKARSQLWRCASINRLVSACSGVLPFGVSPYMADPAAIPTVPRSCACPIPTRDTAMRATVMTTRMIGRANFILRPQLWASEHILCNVLVSVILGSHPAIALIDGYGDGARQ